MFCVVIWIIFRMKNRSSLSMHSKIHSNDRQYGCMVCEQKFVQKINLINHLKVHNSTKTHLCNECGKRWAKTAISFSRQIIEFRIVMNNIVVSFFSFVGQSQLLRHCTQHTNVRAFECEICKKFYKTKRDLKLHLMVHSASRPHKCYVCSKTFLSTSKLKQHLNIHSGDRPFKVSQLIIWRCWINFCVPN